MAFLWGCFCTRGCACTYCLSACRLILILFSYFSFNCVPYFVYDFYINNNSAIWSELQSCEEKICKLLPKVYWQGLKTTTSRLPVESLNHIFCTTTRPAISPESFHVISILRKSSVTVSFNIFFFHFLGTTSILVMVFHHRPLCVRDDSHCSLVFLRIILSAPIPVRESYLLKLYFVSPCDC